MREFTIGEILKAVGGKLISGSTESKVGSVCTDSRTAGPEDLFFSIVGEKNDGHDYLAQVSGKGCTSVVISDLSKVPSEWTGDGSFCADIILVEDTTRALQDLAVYYLETLPLKIKLAVTGSVGKTSTRDMLYYVASVKYKTGRNPKNFNNGFGIPLSILEFDPDIEAAVLEMGMSSAGEIEKLARMVKPDAAVITNIGISHLENLGSRMGILKEKLAVTTYFGEESVLIINADNDMLTEENVQGKYRLIRVGSGEDCDYRISNVTDFGDRGIEYNLYHDGTDYKVSLPVPGAHNAVNSALAVAAGSLMGISCQEAVKGLEKAQLTGKRLNIRINGNIKVIDDTYNACPESMKSALNTLELTEVAEGGRRVAVLGDMYELGSDSILHHREVGQHAAARNIDFIAAVGSDARFYAEAAVEAGCSPETVKYFETKEDFIRQAGDIIGPSDVVLVKASRGMAMEEVVKEIIG